MILPSPGNAKLRQIEPIFNQIQKLYFSFSTSSSGLFRWEKPSLFSIHTSQYPSKRLQFISLLQCQLSQHPSTFFKHIHAQLAVCGLLSDTVLSNILLGSYAKFSSTTDARKLFNSIPKKNLVTWSSMVSMYSQHGFCNDALMLFLEFRRVCDESLNEYILASVIHACVQMDASSDVGSQLHGYAIKSGFQKCTYVGTSLVDLYAKNSRIYEARLAFDIIVVKTAVTWTTMINGYVRSGRSEEALDLFSQMQRNGIHADGYALSALLNACAALKFIDAGMQVHCHVLRKEANMDVSLANVLLVLYSKCGKVQSARKLFDSMVLRNMISWTTMISGYMQNAYDREALYLFSDMTRMGWKADDFACSSVLTSCGSLGFLDEGRVVHAYTIKTNLELDAFVNNALVDMYAKCNSLVDARKSFNNRLDHDVVLYNSIIEGYSSQGRLIEALDLFRSMRLKSVAPTHLTFVSLLNSSMESCSAVLSRQIHGLVIKFGVSIDIFIASALIDVYFNCSYMKDARVIFDEIPEKDAVMWNAMIAGYTQDLEDEEAIKLFYQMQVSKQKPNAYTFSSLMAASSNLASLQQGLQFHSQLIRRGLESDPYVTNAVIDMYAKCGSFKDALKTFVVASLKDTVCWNSMILTCAHHGEAEEALHLFERMTNEGIVPNYVTFVGILSACTHAGLVDFGLHYFRLMNAFGVEPGMEHYACLVSLLGCSGKLNQARKLIETMPIKPAAIVWRCLLAACKLSGNVELGMHAAERAISIDPMDSGSYTLLSNIFASKGMWADVKRVRERMDIEGVLKEPGSSWIEDSDGIHLFIARGRNHENADLIYKVLDNLILQIKGVGNAPDSTILLTNE